MNAMNYHLAVDSGGTKVLAILYDDSFSPIQSCRVGSIRENTTSRELIQRNLDQLVEALSLEGKTLSGIHGTVDSILLKRIRQVCDVKEVHPYSELEIGLAAAGIFGDGYMALSGTGTGLVVRYHGERIGLGGYGAAVSDEGSGYWLAREAFNAAIYDDEQRGPRTLLTELIAQRLGGTRESFRECVFRIYAQNEISPVAYVASCAPLVSEAAYKGDPVALDILYRTGRSLADQMVALIKKHSLPKSLPITVSGSVWRGHPIIYESFRKVLLAFDMSQDILIPDFEPIIGAILCHYFSIQQKFTMEDRAYFHKLYPQFLYSINH